jgi:two-component system OmpR family sensor kinase
MSGAADERRTAGTEDDWLGLVRALVHDLRTPIATASGYLELVQLDGGELPSPLPEYLEQAAAAMHEVSLLATLVGDVARMEAGRRPLRLARAEPRRLLERVVAQRPTHERSRLALAAPGGDETTAVRCDVELVVRTLDAIVNLAFGRSPRDGEVALACRASGGRVRIAVRDQGTAIGEDRVPPLFVHRRTASDSASAAKLALVHARLVAEAHGGAAGATRPAEGGMEFWLELPAAEGVDAGR